MTAAPEPNPVQSADPKARRRALLWLASVACLGSATLFFLQRWIAGISNGEDLQSSRALLVMVLWGMTLLVSVSAAAVAVYVWRLASRSQAALRFPPPGQPVIRDTVILQGHAALRRAMVLRTISILLGLAAASLILLVMFLAKLLGQGAA